MVSYKKSSGFTLIELLVVIAIIAIFAGILFPVFAKARESARASACSSNLKQLTTAWMLYHEEYDAFPANRYDPPNGVHYTWKTAVRNYVKLSAFRCPSNQYYDYPVEGPEPGRSYAMNGSTAHETISESEIKEMSEIIMLCEARYRYPDVRPADAPWSSFLYSYEDNPTPNSYLGVMQTHNGVSNYAFFDGHIKALRPVQTILQGKWTRWLAHLNQPGVGLIRDPEGWRQRRLKELLAHGEYR